MHKNHLTRSDIHLWLKKKTPNKVDIEGMYNNIMRPHITSP